MRILVTGATGFVGSHLVRRLSALSHTVRILRREGSRLDALGGVPVEEVIGDIADAATVDEGVRGCEVVFHSAALIQYWARRNAEQYAVNVSGTRHVAQACLRHKVQRLIHVSSIAAVGCAPDGELATESTPYNLGPLRNNYCDTKYAAEVVVREGIAAGLDAVIVNPGTIYGPGDRRRVGQLRALMSPISARGGMAVVDVDDVVEGILRAWEKGRTGERYILCADNYTYRDLGRLFASYQDRRGPMIDMPRLLLQGIARVSEAWARITHHPPRLTGAMARMATIRLFCSNAKAQNALGMTFRPFPDTARRTIEWYRRHQR